MDFREDVTIFMCSQKKKRETLEFLQRHRVLFHGGEWSTFGQHWHGKPHRKRLGGSLPAEWLNFKHFFWGHGNPTKVVNFFFLFVNSASVVFEKRRSKIVKFTGVPIWMEKDVKDNIQSRHH